MISGGILLYGYIGMDGRIIPKAEKTSLAVTDAFARQLPTSYTLLSPFHDKTFPFFEKNYKLILSALKILVGS